MGGSTALAGNVFVQAGAGGGGDGSLFRPYNTLAQVEAGSGPGDTVYVLPSSDALDGGLQLKDGQTLIGIGTQLYQRDGSSPHARLTNSSSAHLAGDAVRLANDNTVMNIHVDSAWRGGILGINVDNAVVQNNLITNNMAMHSMQTIQEDFIIFQAQRNHYGAITLFGCGPAASSQCTPQDPSSPGIATQRAVIFGNVIENASVEGIMILNDTGISAQYDIEHNSVDGVSLMYPNFNRNDLLPPLVPEVVRSRAFTILIGTDSHSYVNMSHFFATHLAPPGDLASDATVFVTYGTGAVITADLDHVLSTNPDFTGEIVNGDSLEMTTFGSNATFDVRVHDSEFHDTVSTLTKMLEVGVTNGNSYFVDMHNVSLLNVNPRVAVEASLGAMTYFKIGAPGATTTADISIALHNVTMSGHRRGLFINNIAGVHMHSLSIFAENVTMENATNEGFRIFNTNVIDNVTCDMGGGALGSDGRNSFENNGTPADADFTIVNTTASPISCDASRDYWGGAAPVRAPGQNIFTVGNATVNVDSYLKNEPHERGAHGRDD